MKKLLFVFLSIVMIFCFSSLAFAHSGGTDSKGGHYNRSTGDYHYHHGYPEHYHTDGVCPYESSDEDVDETTNDTDDNKQTNNFVKFLACLLGGLFFGYVFGLIPTAVIFILFLVFASKETQNTYQDKLFKVCTILFTTICSILVFIGIWKDLF